MVKSILLISNSFGVNLQTYLNQISKGTDIEFNVGTLYIGGCSLQTHYNNMKSGEKLYEWYFNGPSTGKFVSIQDALTMQKWDYISLQQASHESGIKETYYPYIKELYDYVHAVQPQAEIVFHKTWPYTEDTTHPCFVNYQSNRDIMRLCIDIAVSGATKYVGIKTIIDSGDAINNAYPKFGHDLYDDAGFHMSPKGNYLIAWNAIRRLNPDYKIKEIYVPEGFTKEECLDLLESLK